MTTVQLQIIQLIVSMISPTETVPSWQLEVREQYSPLRMDPLGLQELLVHQTLSMELPT